MQVSHMIYTRTQLSDYGWFLGHSDTGFLDRFERYILSWLRGNDLVDSVPIITFSEIEGRFVLMKTAWSETRLDRDRRPILERCAFAWNFDASLRYGQLVAMLAHLDSSSLSQLASIPDDVFRLEPKPMAYDYDFSDLPTSPRLHELIKSLPHKLHLGDIINSHISIEFYNGLSFSNLVSIIAEEPIQADGFVQLAHALPSHLRIKNHRSWLTVLAGRDAASLTAENPYRIQTEAGAPERTLISSSPIQPKPHQQQLNYRPEEDIKYNISKQNQRGTDNVTNRVRQLSTVASEEKPFLTKLFFHSSDTLVNIERSSVSILDDVNSITVLLSSVHFDISIDLFIAWQNLLREIILSLSYQQPSSMQEEWSRRISQLVQMTIPKKIPSELRAWAKELTLRSRRLMDRMGGSADID